MEPIGWACLGFVTGFFFCLSGIFIFLYNIKTKYDIKIKSRKEN